jgi:hypothetical protein
MIDLSKIPSFTIDLGSLLNACEVKSIMKKLGVRYYCYVFSFDNTVMKIGMSADNDWQRGSYGERIYRQSFHIPGWPSKPSVTTPGYKDIQQLLPYFPTLHKSKVKINVFDMTGYPFQCSYSPKLEVGDLEKQLMNDYVTKFNRLPVGNVVDERTKPVKGRVLDETIERLFSNED